MHLFIFGFALIACAAARLDGDATPKGKSKAEDKTKSEDKATSEDKGLALLKSNSLKAGGGYYTLPEESELSKGLGELATLKKGLTAAQKENNASVRDQQLNEARIQELMVQLRTLRSQLDRASNNTELHNRIVGQLNSDGEELTERQKRSFDRDVGKAARAKLSEAREKYINKLLSLRAAAERAAKQYETFSGDAAITAAVEAANEELSKKYELGPSKAFARSVRSLEKIEATVMTENIQLEREHGTFSLDVVLNGRYSKKMIFDTGASSISLPSSMAAEVGLKPDENTPTVHVQIADGRTIEAKKMTLESVKVGKFTVENVECIVMPRHLTDVPALLGGAFLNQFNYKMDPDTGKLHLSKVENMAGDAKETKGKATKKPVKKKAE